MHLCSKPINKAKSFINCNFLSGYILLLLFFSQSCLKTFPILLFHLLNASSNSSLSTHSSKANLFASPFSSNSNLNDQESQSPFSPTFTITIPCTIFSTREVAKAHLQLNSSESKRPALVQRSCVPELASFLSKLQLSFTLGIFPSSWKLAHIFHIQKGEKHDSSNYQPIIISFLILQSMETKYIQTTAYPP